jgi:hypothetical protein
MLQSQKDVAALEAMLRNVAESFDKCLHEKQAVDQLGGYDATTKLVQQLQQQREEISQRIAALEETLTIMVALLLVLRVEPSLNFWFFLEPTQAYAETSTQ